MVHRKGLVRAAACAALACAGISRADTGSSGSDDVLRPLFMQAAPAPAAAPASAPATPPTPLMGFLETTPIGPKFLDPMGITVTGYFEGGYTASLNHPPGNVITGRIFDTRNEHIVLDQANIAFDRAIDNTKMNFQVGGHFEAIYGFDSGLIHSDGLYDGPGQHYAGSNGAYYKSRTAPENQFDIAQAYVDVFLPVGTGLKITAGKIYTYLGYEVISPTGNQFYSHSYMFGYAIPFTNTGIWGEYNVGDFKIDAGGSIGEGQSLDDNNSTPDFVGELTWKPQGSNLLKQMTFILNGEFGPEATHDNHDYWTVIDFNAKWQFMGDGSVPGSMYAAVDIDYGDAPHGLVTKSPQWGGVAIYTNYINTPQIQFNTRVEWYNDAQGFTLGQAGGLNVYEATAGFTIQPLTDAIGQNLKIRPEARIDYSDKDFFNGGVRHFQSSFGIDAYFAY